MEDNLKESILRLALRVKEDNRYFGNATILTFTPVKGVTVTLRFKLKDEQSGADIAITNMTVKPDSEIHKGHDRKLVEVFVGVCLDQGLRNIQAVQVLKESEGFWLKMGFEKLNNITNDFRYCSRG